MVAYNLIDFKLTICLNLIKINNSASASEIMHDGHGYIIFTDASRSVTRQYEISSETYNLSYSLPGATLFRGLFTFNGEEFSTKIRVPME